MACDSPCETALMGICKRGLVDCSAGAPVCRSAIKPGERLEVCNGEDDNCDGRIDEGFDKDGDGYTTCGGDCDDRNPSVHPDAVERCNGKDDNCNGLVDDGFNVGGVCTAGLGDCAIEGRRRCSQDGLSAECDAKAGLPARESCDGRDNDCDGVVDNGLGEMSCGVGACRRTVPTCMSGSQTACAPGEPGSELCGDGIDNDCDGEVDEGFSIAGQSCYAGVGACRRPGKMVCDATRLSTECDASAGEPGIELCGNRIDDDCDGETDTDTPELGAPCSNGMPGECLREGTLVCDARQNKLVCSAPEGKPSREICDGLDNDCDGVVDNGVLERVGCGQGACAGGQKERRCAMGLWSEWSECSTAGRATGEVCGDRIDNDCNGIVDADAPGLGASCENQQVGGCVRQGKFVCGGPDGSLICSAPTVAPSEEVCNGIDDDCDGAIDEGVTNVCGGCKDLPGVFGESCAVPGGDGCAVGRWSCNEKEMTCALDASLSNGKPCELDADPCTRDACSAGRCEHPPVSDGTPCDDRNACTSGDSCFGGVCEGSASLSCEDGELCSVKSCSPLKGCVSVAVGGGTKNECGGCEVLAAAPGDECEVAGRSGVCAKGVFACLPDGSVACVQQLFGVREECNGVDDNCNGEVDEGLGETSCGIGACSVTVANCELGTPASCVPKDPRPEDCSNMGFDDDCNGVEDDVAMLESDCPASIGTCIMPGRMQCVGDATAPVCVPVDRRYAEDDDGNGVVNYCDHGATLAGGAEEVGDKLAAAHREAGGHRLYDASRTRALMLPWSNAFDSVAIAPESSDQALLVVSGIAGAEGGIAALRAKDLGTPGSAVFRSCVAPASESPQKLLVVGTVADLVASTSSGYARYPKIASQIPSPLLGNYKCRLSGEKIVANARRSFAAKGGELSCEGGRVFAVELISERPLSFAGAVVCSLPASSFWEKQGSGVGLDLVAEGPSGGFAHEFVSFATGEGQAEGAVLAPLSRRYGGGFFIAATFGDKNIGGICRRGERGWRCTRQELVQVQGPLAFAGYPAGRDDGPLVLVSADGAAFEVSLVSDGDSIGLSPAGGLPAGAGNRLVAALSFPAQGDRPPTLIVGREGGLSASAVRFPNAANSGKAPAAFGVLRELPGESILPEAPADDVFQGGKVSFRQPHAMTLLPLKGYGGRDLFVAYRIMAGSKQIGEMGFFYWNANDRPVGSLSDIRFDGRRGSAKLSFADPTGDPLSYRANVRARHGGSLDDWLDGFEGGRLRFSVKGDPSGVGIWPIEIMVWASDPGGLSAGSRVVLKRDGSVEAISESAGGAQ